MSCYSMSDELCIVYEKTSPPRITQKEAESIKHAVRNSFYGVTQKESESVKHAVRNSFHGVTQKESESIKRAVRKGFYGGAKSEHQPTTISNALVNVGVAVSKQPASSGCKIDSSLQNTGCVSFPSTITLPNELKSSAMTNPQRTRRNRAQYKNGANMSTVQSVKHHSVTPLAAGKPNMPNHMATTTVNSVNTVKSQAVPHALQMSGKMNPEVQDGRCTTVVVNSTSACVSQSLKVSDLKNPKVVGDNCVPTVTYSNISTNAFKNQNGLVTSLPLQSKLETINRLGILVTPVSPIKSNEHSITDVKNKQAKEVLENHSVNISLDPAEVMPNLVPAVSVKLESISQPAPNALAAQNNKTNDSKMQLTCSNVTPSKSNVSQVVNMTLSPQLKARPWKFLNPSPGSCKTSAVFAHKRKLSFKMSPRKRSWRNKSSVKSRMTKTSNFYSNRTDNGSGARDVSAVSSSTTMDDIYCKHFRLLLLKVISCFYFLFSEPEMQFILNFTKLSSPSKKLYIRMFSRKFCWHRASEIVYEKLADNLVPFVEELEFRDFVTLDCSGEDLHTLLGLLKVPELKQLCHDLHVPLSATTKEGQIEALLQYGRNQQTLSPAHDFKNVVRKELQKMLGECFKLCEEPRRLFHRVLLLTTLPWRKTGPVEVLPLLIMMHEVEIGKIKFPEYPLSSEVLFTCQEQLVGFHDADDLCNELLEAVSRKDMQQIQTLCSEAKIRFVLLMGNENERARVSTLPLFVRRFTGCSKYAYALGSSAEALRKERASHKVAIEILELLLGQDVFLTHHRGFWYDKLALILHFHQHDLQKAADVIIRAMSDSYVTEVQKYDLVARGHRIFNAKNNGLSKQQKRDLYFSLDDYMDDPPSITIRAKVLPIQGPGRKRVYVEVDLENQQMRYSSVEEYAISYYKKQGYACGYHTEGAIVSSLFALLMWDILYEQPVPATFVGLYQAAPLDLNYPEFYASRCDLINDKLRQMEEMSIEQLQAVVAERHGKHAGTSSLVNWDLLPDVNRATVLVACLGTRLLARICERFAKNYRTARSGFPDLLVWSPSEQKCKIVEVKGPNDHLSGNQVLWLNYLIAAGADAEVCHVQTTGSKATKRKNSDSEIEVV